VNVTGGGICIDLAAGMAQLTETYEIARGTGRFKRASGTLNLTVTVVPVLFNADGGAQLLTMTEKSRAPYPEPSATGTVRRAEGAGPPTLRRTLRKSRSAEHARGIETPGTLLCRRWRGKPSKVARSLLEP
jgi:hypothetical protein